MGQIWLQRFATTVTLALLCVGCAKDQNREWINNDNEPVSVVNSNYCDGLTESDLQRPDVDENPETGVWRIEYPAFTSECGAYQLTGIFDFSDPDRGGEPSYTYDIDVCNRCEDQKNWNYLSDSEFPLDVVEEYPENLEVPENPELKAVSSFGHDGLPLVEHGASRQKTMMELGCPQARGWILYGTIRQFRIPSDVTNTQKWPIDFDTAGRSLLEGQAAGSNMTTILWPKLYHTEARITGLHAASLLDHCGADDQEDGEYIPGAFYRPYDAPYDVEKKYVEQTVDLPELPEEFLRALRLHADR